MYSDQLHFRGNSQEGWVALLPDNAPTFFSLPVTIQIDSSDTDGTPYSDHVLLTERILKDIGTALPAAEKAFTEYQAGTEEDWRALVTDPHIRFWDDEEPDRWDLLVRRIDWEHFTWFIGFRDTQVIQVWGGS